MHWLLATNVGFDIYTDHNNIVFIFDPLSVSPNLSLSSVKRVLRWAVQMSMYNYVCFHIKGADNVWADLISRWMPVRLITKLIFIPPLLSSSSENFEWQSNREIIKCQEQSIATKPSYLKMFIEIWRDDKNRIWIPDDLEDLRLRICIIGHTGPAGHREFNTTLENIGSQVIRPTISEDVEKFVQSCIHCTSTTRGNQEPRPFGPAFHGTPSNALLRFAFLEMAPTSTGMKHILMIRDYFPSCSWFVPCSNANGETAADAMLEFCTTFSTPRGLMTDEGSHFRNETVRLLTKSIRILHHFTLPYTPSSVKGRSNILQEKYANLAKVWKNQYLIRIFVLALQFGIISQY